MTSYNAANERMKRQYFAYLAEAQGHSEQTHRRGGEGDCPVRSLYPVQGLQGVPYRAGQGASSAILPTSGATGAASR